MSPYYTGPVPTAPRFWDMKASVTADANIDRSFHMSGHFDMRSLKDAAEILSSPDSSEYYTPNLTQDGFINSVPSTTYCTPESAQISSERRAAMYHHCSSPESPSVSPSPSPTDSMFSRPSRPDSATSFVESADECHGHKRSPYRQRSVVPSLVVTDYDSDEDHKPRVDAVQVQQTFARPQVPVQRSIDLRAEAVSFQPRQARDPRQIASVPMPSINGNATPVVLPQARAPPQYTLPPRSHPFANQGMNQLPRPVAPATVAPRYKQVPAFQVVPRRFPTPKPVLAMRMASGPQPPMQPMPNVPQARGIKPQAQQQSTLYDSRGQTFEGKTVTVRPSMPRVPAMPLSSVRHLWPASDAPLPNAKTNSNVWHPSLQEAETIILIQQARILNGLSNGVPYGGGLYLPIPFDENFA